MNKNKFIFLLVLWKFCMTGSIVLAQDSQPPLSIPDTPLTFIQPLKDPLRIDSVIVSVTLPVEFKGIQENNIVDPNKILDPILERFRLFKAGVSVDSLRIVHIGDSHVRGHIFPQTAGDKLKEDFGKIIYTDMGVNGATCLTFTHPQRIETIVEAKPDFLILSFGTNESHNRRYNKNVHYHQMDELIKLLRIEMPTVPILLTTPPGSYESFRRSRRRRTYSINPRTKIAADNINQYALNNKLAVWDMYNILGGASRACLNWKEAGLMRPDHVHYLPEAYVLHGELLYEALIKLYNTYVSY
ncbi:MAG: SGNH/GDSL hydrolase family protein [Bacteroides sp.]|nr:SGNH/GDSL hydrolase family protein [Bacteroides sp.]